MKHCTASKIACMRLESGSDRFFQKIWLAAWKIPPQRPHRALNDYSEWLRSRLDTMQTAFAVGPDAYQWFLINVALIPYTPDELLAQGAQAWNRSVAWDAIEQNRNRDVPAMSLFKTVTSKCRPRS